MDAAAEKKEAARGDVRSLTLAATWLRVAMSVSEWLRRKRKRVRAEIRSLTLAATWLWVAMSEWMRLRRERKRVREGWGGYFYVA